MKKGEKGKKQSAEHIRKRVEARRQHNPSWMPPGYTVWNKGETKDTDSRINEYAKKMLKGKKDHAAGYVYIYAPEHPANWKGYVFEHRIMMEKHIRRYLYKHETIHHINGDRKDNRIENLQLMTQKEHAGIHYESRKKDKKGRFQ